MTDEAATNRWLPWALVGLIVLAGLLLRLILFQQSAFGDEMSTLWIVKGNDLAGVFSAVYSDAEISPPLYFSLAELSTVFGETVSAVRLPSLVAGFASIPLFFLVGDRLLGRRAAIYAALIASISPFLVYFSANARAYSVMILMILVATLALAHATSGRGRWFHWVGWAAFSCLAVYSHYTAALVVAGQLLWVLCFFPGLRLRAVAYAGLSALLFVPWAWGFRADLNSPTSEILQLLQRSGFSEKWDATWQMVLLRLDLAEPSLFWDRPDMLLAMLGATVLLAALGRKVARGGFPVRFEQRGHGVLLVAFMTFAVIGGELLMLALGTDIYGARNLAPAWAGLPLLVAAGCAAAGSVAGLVSLILIASGFSLGTIHLADPENTTIDFKSAADLIESRDSPGGAVLDGSILSPAPQAPLDAYLDTEMETFRLTATEDRPDFIDDIFATYDPQAVADRAFAGPGPVELVTIGSGTLPFKRDTPGGTSYGFETDSGRVSIPRGWERAGQTRFEGLTPITVTRFEKTRGAGGEN